MRSRISRRSLGRALPPILAALVIGACGSTVQEGSELTVYASAPLAGPDARVGRALVDGMEDALAEAGGEAGGAPITLEVLDDTSPPAGGGPRVWTQAQIGANARAAAEDSVSIAYLGEAAPSATRLSAPITNEAGIPQISPGPVDPAVLAEPGGNDVPPEFQSSGERTVIALGEPGERLDPDGAEAAGREAMALLLDAIGRAVNPLDRASVTAALLDTSGRTSPLGTYSISPTGQAGFAP
ncbi:MAG TPA: hypothetical protein VKA36_11215 [Solirubrobacterales bacterium]|nr:hypothetical protein [Solirubrobacterales bacterium]